MSTIFAICFNGDVIYGPLYEMTYVPHDIAAKKEPLLSDKPSGNGRKQILLLFKISVTSLDFLLKKNEIFNYSWRWNGR